MVQIDSSPGRTSKSIRRSIKLANRWPNPGLRSKSYLLKSTSLRGLTLKLLGYDK